MKCFICGSEQSSVVDKRSVETTGEIRRRRECLKCHNRYTTYERMGLMELFVLKRDGRRELFDKNKIKTGLLRALEKRPGIENVDSLVDLIVKKLKIQEKKLIETKLIGKIILAELKKIDTVAYLRFASVYRHFENPSDFTKELASLKF